MPALRHAARTENNRIKLLEIEATKERQAAGARQRQGHVTRFTPQEAIARLRQLTADPKWRDHLLNTGNAAVRREFNELSALAAEGGEQIQEIEIVDAVSDPHAVSKANYAALLDAVREHGLPDKSEDYIKSIDSGERNDRPTEGDGIACRQALDRLMKDPTFRTNVLSGDVAANNILNTLNRVIAYAAPDDGQPVPANTRAAGAGKYSGCSRQAWPAMNAPLPARSKEDWGQLGPAMKALPNDRWRAFVEFYLLETFANKSRDNYAGSSTLVAEAVGVPSPTTMRTPLVAETAPGTQTRMARVCAANAVEAADFAVANRGKAISVATERSIRSADCAGQDAERVAPVFGQMGCVGHLLRTAKGFRAYDRDDKEIGTFENINQAVLVATVDC